MSLLRWIVLAGSVGLSVTSAAAGVAIDWVTVGHPGNAADTASNCYSASCGAVSVTYRIAQYEVTNTQYVEFLNFKAATDPLGLYDTAMGSQSWGGIERSGSPGSYTYSVKAGFEDKPVNYVSFFDALRFANWLNNGQGTADTETGSYTLLGGTATPSNGLSVVRNPAAGVVLPSENEWYKAAYYDAPSSSWLDYPAGSNAATVCAAPGSTPNTANCGNAVANVTDVGAYEVAVSPFGTFDQGGNVWEWNEEIVSESFRGIRGGTWLQSAGFLAASSANFSDPATSASTVGFRVANVEPATSVPSVHPFLLLTLVPALLAVTGGLAIRRRTG